MSTDYLALCHRFFGLPFSLLYINCFLCVMCRPTEFVKIMNGTEICSRFSDLLEEFKFLKESRTRNFQRNL